MAGMRFRGVHHGSARRRYLHIHGNETAARRVLSEHMRVALGSAWFVESAARYLEFRAGRIDPNRMFSRDGADRNLRRLNPRWNEAQILNGLLTLERERHKLLNQLDPGTGGLIFALHNNGEGYSAENEAPISNRTAMNDRAHPHEFFLATDPRDFETLAGSAYNVLLQNDPRGPDDGSLSRWSARAGIRYVNLECGMGEARKQREMLEWAESRLG